MLVFLDTEYTDAIDCDLISVGMVSQDGKHELYLERADYRAEWCNSFVQAAVLPQLAGAGHALDRHQFALRLAAWFATLPRSVQIGCDSFTDWELLLDALGDVRPPNLVSRYDLRSLVDSSSFHHAVVAYHERHGGWHHALHDARAHRYGWMAWADKRKAGQTYGK